MPVRTCPSKMIRSTGPGSEQATMAIWSLLLSRDGFGGKLLMRKTGMSTFYGPNSKTMSTSKPKATNSDKRTLSSPQGSAKKSKRYSARQLWTNQHAWASTTTKAHKKQTSLNVPEPSPHCREISGAIESQSSLQLKNSDKPWTKRSPRCWTSF